MNTTLHLKIVNDFVEFYLFEDEAENEYTWTTAARKLELGETYEVVGTIKALSKYELVEFTVRK